MFVANQYSFAQCIVVSNLGIAERHLLDQDHVRRVGSRNTNSPRQSHGLGCLGEEYRHYADATDETNPASEALPADCR